MYRPTQIKYCLWYYTTHPSRQWPAERTIVSEIREAPHTPTPSRISATWYGNCPGVASLPSVMRGLISSSLIITFIN